MPYPESHFRKLKTLTFEVKRAKEPKPAFFHRCLPVSLQKWELRIVTLSHSRPQRSLGFIFLLTNFLRHRTFGKRGLLSIQTCFLASHLLTWSTASVWVQGIGKKKTWMLVKNHKSVAKNRKVRYTANSEPEIFRCPHLQTRCSIPLKGVFGCKTWPHLQTTSGAVFGAVLTFGNCKKKNLLRLRRI